MKTYFSTLKYLITLIGCILFFSCGNDPLEIDVTNVTVDLKLKRFEQDLFNIKTEITPEVAESLNKKYGLFFQDFTQSIINIGPYNNPETQYHLNAFKNDSYINDVRTDVNLIYSDFTPYQKELEDAFKHYKHYFPKKQIPEIITYISGFNYAIVTDKNYLGIGLDMFLGSNHEAYPNLGLPKYKTDFMNKESLVAGAMIGWVSTEFELNEKNADLLTEMVHQGKLLYIIDALIPSTPKGIKISYNEEQIAWCKTNAEPVWFYFIDNKLLYTKETTEIIKYMGEAPFIQGFPEGSPGRIGHWVGWQIVTAYMQNNPSITIEQLANEQDMQKILNKSKYKP